ncbi:MAG: LrgB family protein [Cellvibrionaceae bacterium]
MSSTDLTEIWVYLSASPLLGLTLTLVAYTSAYKLYVVCNANPLLNPVLISATVIISILLVTGTEYQTYFDGAQYIHFLLGPATVALAIPLYQQVSKLKKLWFPLIVSLLSGVVIGALSSIFIARFFGADLETQLSIAPKSVTAPIAMGIAEQLGGLPSLTAALVMLTGITGALICTRLFAIIGIKDDSVKGIALGVTSHGIGTARAFQISDEMGAFSGLAMALSAFATAIILPWLAQWFF